MPATTPLTAALAAVAVAPGPDHLASHDSLANLLGWLSLASWLLVYSPQIWENYTRQSGEGVSLWFILIWLLGDLTNFFGAYWQGLLPTMIILSVYYIICDFIIIFQIYYYRSKHRRAARQAVMPPGSDHDERTSLIQSEPLSGFVADEGDTKRMPSMFRTAAFVYTSAFSFIIVFGVAGWLATEIQARGTPRDAPSEGSRDGAGSGGEEWDVSAQVMGWISAASYLGSRIPQIFKNRETKCIGLSMLFFLVGITGNVTYVGSILAKSLDLAHIWINLSWLIGSAGTIFLNFIVLFQFWTYRHARSEGAKTLQESSMGDAIAATI